MKFTGERFIPTEVTDHELEVEHFQRYHFAKKYIVDKIVLDAACGEGYGSSIFSEFASKVYGMDISEDAISNAKSKYPNNNIEFIKASISKIPLEDSSVDVVVSFETIEHVDSHIQFEFLNEIKRVLKVDGLLIMSTPNKKIYSDLFNYSNEFHIKEFYIDEFKNFISSQFINSIIFGQFNENTAILGNCNTDTLQYRNGFDVNNSKYIICVASNSEIPDMKIGLADTTSDNTNLKQLQRILQLQDEVDERNQHLMKLDGQIIEQNHNLIIKNTEVENAEIIYQQLKTEKCKIADENNKIKDENNKVKDENNKIKDENNKIKDENNKIKDENIHCVEELKIEKSEKKQVIEELNKNRLEFSLTTERLINQENEKHTLLVELKSLENQNEVIKKTLENREEELYKIYNSKGWKLLLKLYKVEDVLFLRNSKLRSFMKIGRTFFTNPVLYKRYFRVSNVKKIINYLKTEDISRIDERINNFEMRFNEPPRPTLELFDNIQEDVVEFEKNENPLVSIVIPVYNQWSYTYSCLKSILDNTKDVSYEIIIADDVSNDKTANINDYTRNITVVRNETNLGFLLNCNNAAKSAKGKYVLFLNNDTNVQSNWLSSLVELIESDAQIGMVGSKLVYPDGKLQEAGGIIWKDASGWNYGRFDDAAKSEYNYVKEVDYISGASIMIRKELWQKIGGFDELYIPAYCEDSDLAFEVRARGYKVMYQPKSVVVHFEGVSHGTDENQGLKKYQEENKIKFYEKWKKILNEEHFENAVNVFEARDRSSQKKCLLVIDHYVPHYDKDAGSRTVYQFIEFITQKGYCVKFIGDNFYPHEPYTAALQKMGVEVLYGKDYSDNWKKWIKDNSNSFDYVWLNRPHISEKYIDYIKMHTNAKIVYYGCDLHFLREAREYELTKNKETLNSSVKWEKRELDIIKKSDISLYPSEVEVQEIKKLYPEAKVISVPVFIYPKQEALDYNFDSRDGIMFVGGFGHTPNVDGVLWFAKEVMPYVIAQNEKIKFYILGSNPTSEILKLNSNNIIVKGFVSDETLIEFYKNTKFSVVPLRYGAGIKGKVIEALYHQVPVVTTKIGAEGIVGAEKALMVVDDPIELANAILRLYTDSEQLIEMSYEARSFINECYSEESVVNVLKKIVSLVQ